MNEIITNIRCGILIMLDLSAAFDTVDHEILIEDLKIVGIEEEVLKCFRSYLNNRKATVVISRIKSAIQILTRGVPQGSVLGPLLFCIYTIELSRILKSHNVKFKL